MAHPDNPTWPNIIADNLETTGGDSTLVPFLHSIDRLAIKPEYLKGNIAVIGQGQAFPERALLTTDRFHEQLNRDISLLVCFDSTPYSSPEYLLTTDVVVAPESEEIARLPYGSVVYYPWGAKYAIDDYGLPSNFIDTVLAFQIVNLAEQLNEGLLQSITDILRPGGHFIGSGGTRHTPQDYYEQITKGHTDQMNLIQQVRLSNPSPAGYPFNEHIGVILQKK